MVHAGDGADLTVDGARFDFNRAWDDGGVFALGDDAVIDLSGMEANWNFALEKGFDFGGPGSFSSDADGLTSLGAFSHWSDVAFL